MLMISQRSGCYRSPQCVPAFRQAFVRSLARADRREWYICAQVWGCYYGTVDAAGDSKLGILCVRFLFPCSV
jgi:hypothetical protein